MIHPALKILFEEVKKVEEGWEKYSKLTLDKSNSVLPEYMAIGRIHGMYREGSLTKEQFVEYVDEVLCY